MTAYRQYDFTDSLSDPQRRLSPPSPRSVMTTDPGVRTRDHWIGVDAATSGHGSAL